MFKCAKKLNAKNKQDIERVQRNAFSVICGIYGKPYELLLEEMEQDTLLLRRDKLSLKFANKCLKTDKFKSWFQEVVSTRSGLHYFNDDYKTKRFSNSAIPYMTRLLNSSISKI